MIAPEWVEAQVTALESAGFVVIPDALAAEEVSKMRACAEADRQQNPERWSMLGPGSQGWPELDDAARKKVMGMGGGIDEKRKIEIATGEAGRWQTANNSLLYDSEAFDAATVAPRVLTVVDRLMGGKLVCNTLDCMWRAPVPEAPPPGEVAHHQMWHREAGAAFDPHAPRCIDMIQVIYYLTDVSSATHCFSSVPESLAAKRALPARPVDKAGRPPFVVDDYDPKSAWRTKSRSDAVDIVGKAGTVLLL